LYYNEIKYLSEGRKCESGFCAISRTKAPVDAAGYKRRVNFAFGLRTAEIIKKNKGELKNEN